MKERKHVKEIPVVIYDKNGLPNMMLKLENTAPTKEQADPVFIVKGVEYDSVCLSRFLNSAVGNQVVSLPFRDPLADIDMNDAIRKIRQKGEGWHLLTNCEWQYIKDTTRPGTHGNTSYGKYHENDAERGIFSNYWRTQTGSGPASWFHNGNRETGIADTVGNVWKFVSGIRLKNGTLEYMPNNDAASPDADLSENSTEFLEVLVDGLPVKIGHKEKRLMITTGKVESWDYANRGKVCIDLKTVPDILKDLGIIIDDADSEMEIFSADTELEEAICIVGGSSNSAFSSGTSAVMFDNHRTDTDVSLGLFSALLGNPVIR